MFLVWDFELPTWIEELAETGDAGALGQVFDEHITTRDGQAYTERYTACQTASGEWVLQG